MNPIEFDIEAAKSRLLEASEDPTFHRSSNFCSFDKLYTLISYDVSTRNKSRGVPVS